MDGPPKERFAIAVMASEPPPAPAGKRGRRARPCRRRARLRSTAALVCAALALGGCETAERRCAAFYHPVADDWATARSVGDTASFASADGARATLTLLAREDSAPYTATHESDERRIVCRMRSARRYALGDGGEAPSGDALSLEFMQSEPFGAPIEEQPLFLSLTPQAPSGTDLGFGFLFNVSDPATFHGEGRADADEVRRTRHLTDVTIGERTYASAVEQRLLDTADVGARAPTSAVGVISVIFAEGAGLVRFERLDGATFTRVGVEP